jgi:hypothetical protein
MTKKRDKEYGPKPQDVALKREDLPQRSAKLPSAYCKKLKAEHQFELDDIQVYKHISRPQGSKGPIVMTGFANWKTYRCTACGKKKSEREEHKLDNPVVLTN